MTPERGVGEERWWLPKGKNIETYHAQIFDKWGNKLWESTFVDPDGSTLEPFYGLFKGQLLPQGSYVWRIDATFQDGAVWLGQDDGSGVKKNVGTVTIIR